MVRLNTAEREPKELKPAMTRWRHGLQGIPQEYIAYHRGLAEQELVDMAAKYSLRAVHASELVYDGWLDGMKVLQAIVETNNGKLHKLKWHDGGPNFMMAAKGGGWVQISEEDLQ
jgi:hypothetical protein